ncbi:bis(5'-nucleosyl)-tetraphosphatase (symmetrical) YqeK [bacterium]|jgi:predicted HD superfamily hydrolase involved in NAD metabolism|nr:bis(5'-nucleosyl)-tetraphosphatase (symmetrical) YqeK [bacterium]
MDYISLNIESLLDWLKNNLSEKRYQHSLGTAECARNLAISYKLDEEKAYIAGLLHDCAKCFPNEKLLSIIDRHIEVDENEKMNYKTLHAPVSAYVAEKTFGVKDEEILSSIRWHTLGKVNMTEFEKIIFIADKIEERTRENWYAQPIRALLRESNGLDKAILQCYRQTIKSLVDRDLKICPLTIDIYNHYEDIVGTK